MARQAIALVSLLASAACNQIMGPTTPDTNWRVHQTARFALHVRPGSFADEQAPALGDILDDHFEHTRRVLGLSYDGRVSAFLYNSLSDVEPHAPSNYSGVGFADTETMSAVCVPPLGANLAHLLTHEANHVIMGRGMGRHGTAFISEGMASAVMSATYYPALQTGVHGWAQSHRDQLPPIDALVDDDRWEDFPEEIAYKSSASFLLYVLERYGPSVIRQLYPATSSEFARRFQEIVGRSLADVEADWHRFLAGRAS